MCLDLVLLQDIKDMWNEKDALEQELRELEM
jgi:hypothetical protein